jgi:hypothetical protein
LNELRDIERYLHGVMNDGEQERFRQEAAAPPRRLNIFLQQKIYSLLRYYDRRKRKADMEALHQQLFTDDRRKEFYQRIVSLFKN